MEEKYLPLGSIVMLGGGQKQLMVTGYCMETPENPNKIFDYCGCIFPEGIIRSDLTCVFDHSQIEKVFCKGYIDAAASEFLEKLKNKGLEFNSETKEPELPENGLVTPIEENKVAADQPLLTPISSSPNTIVIDEDQENEMQEDFPSNDE